MVKKSLLWFYRATLVTLWTIIIVLAISVLSLRYLILPNIDQYKDQIAHEASIAAGQKVTIGNIDASWDGLNPHFSLLDVQLYDTQDRPALSLSHIEASLSWLSIPLLEPRLSSITVHKPELTIRRETDGTIFIAGIAMGGPSRPEFPNWLLRQSQIDVLSATILWQDDMRKAPPLTLNDLNLQIISPAWKGLIGNHRFGLRATPSAGSSYPIDIRGNVYGKDVSDLDDWRGTIYAKAEGTNIAAWRHWVTYEFDLRQGYGAAQTWMKFSKGKINSVTSDVILSRVKARISKNSPLAALGELKGRLQWIQHDDGNEFNAEHIKLTTENGPSLENGNISIRERASGEKEWVEGKVQLDDIELASVSTFANYLPLPADTLKQVAEVAAVGRLKNLNVSWKGNQSALSKYSVRSKFSGLGMNPYKQIPGFSNLSGNIDADEKSGTLNINSQKADLNLEQIMRWPIPADKLTGQVQWQNDKGNTNVQLSNLAISNAHLAGTINGSYLHNHIKGGYLDLSAKFGHADAKYAHYYYPKILGEHTLNWLDTSILAGKGDDINVIVRGNLDEFPYPNNKLGLFKVTAKISDAVLEYGIDWPKIEDIKLDMLFEGMRMELNATQGKIFGNQIKKAKIAIAELHVEQPVLTVVGETSGPVSEGIKFINHSPISKLTEGFTNDLQTSGNGNLTLGLNIPLHDIEATKVKGSYVVSNGTMASDAIPALSRINGKLDFTESSLSAQNVNTWAYGGPAQFSLATGKDHAIRISTRGRVTDSGLKQAFGPGFTDRLTGSAEWSGDINILQGKVDINIASSLVGMASTLPPPLIKSANDPLYLKFEKKQPSANQDFINVSLGTLIAAKIQRSQQNGAFHADKGEIGLNVAPEIPAQAGIGVRGSLDNLDVDEWRNIFDKMPASSPSNNAINIARVDLSVNVLDAFDKRINNLKLLAKPTADGWAMTMQSKEITGDVQWHRQGNGKVTAKLKNLIAPSAVPGTAELRTQGDFKQQEQQYPALDITADNFEIGKKKLGRLELQASEQDDDWSIEKLKLITPESTLSAEGEWHNWKRNPNTRINVSWDINDLGKTLERFGYPNTIKGGEADLSGQLKWPGSPHEFNIPGLAGNLQLDARHGQILKIQPGVGRLFSVLSLQNLPRRLTFDFRDVFSSGFTFDKIGASVKIDRGVMRSDDFKMEGPTALVEIKGETDLQKETQHLYVNITPYISDSLSIAALAGGPIVGAAAYVAQKVLKDPINKLAADNYEIVGTWDNPQELKSGLKPKQIGPTPASGIPGN
ncbi:TIGR02099 family protein [Methylovorus sp. MM2]|uniref:YhdP family protein n=1 Tax=Methylovorus sp. MM2 TaxID=1848038 RepID=UPI0007DF51F6|nr:YhdP family protein [Methylovorus sp. MM2]OAM52795.1 TIGR02099 family protein [Methylovorus sp. MM2]